MIVKPISLRMTACTNVNRIENIGNPYQRFQPCLNHCSGFAALICTLYTHVTLFFVVDVSDSDFSGPAPGPALGHWHCHSTVTSDMIRLAGRHAHWQMGFQVWHYRHWHWYRPGPPAWARGPGPA
jgi:hypothetical protein